MKSSQMLVFEERGNRSTRRKPLGAESNQQTQPTYDARSGNRTRATPVEGECSDHHAIPTPQIPLQVMLLLILYLLPSYSTGSPV